MQEWVNELSSGYINSVGPELQVFKMDKVETQLDELYGESRQGRIYLPPFPIRAVFNTNQWVGFLDMEQFKEREEILVAKVNFADMVKIVSDLRKKHVSEIFIKYSGRGIPSIEKINNVLTLYINNKSYLTFDLTNNMFSTVRKLGSRINDYPDWSCVLAGQNDLSVNLIDFNKTSFSERETMIYSIDKTYQNITDVIELGDVIITDKNRMYEVTGAKPSGEFGWNYSLWQLDLELAQVDRFNLPGNYISRIKKANQLGNLKTRME